MRNPALVALPALVLLFMAASTASAQQPARLLDRYGHTGGELYGVLAAAMRGDTLVVLTRPEPAVHMFTPDGYEAWGREGGGPSELQAPSALVVTDEGLLVLDVNQHKIVSWRRDGGFITARSLGPTWARRLYVTGRDTILGMFTPMTGDHAVALIHGVEHDTLLAYNSMQNTVRLEAEGAPSLTVPTPFSPQPVWTVLPDATVAYWDAARSEIRFTDEHGRVTRRLTPSVDPWRVSDADRAWWFEDAIPSEFMGRRGIFEPLRRVAHERVEFPEQLPAVLEIMADPVSGVWIRRTTPATGEVWTGIGSDGRVGTSLRFPPGRTLLSISRRGFVVLARDDLDMEFIELYERAPQ